MYESVCYSTLVNPELKETVTLLTLQWEPTLLSKKYSSSNLVLYRDEGLLVFGSISGQAEKT